MKSENLVIILSIFGSIIVTTIIAVPLYFVVDLPYNYIPSDHLQIKHDNIATVSCIIYTDCDEYGCSKSYESTCSSVNVWLVNMDSNNEVCNYQHLKDSLERLQYLIQNYYKLDSIISGYISKKHKDKCQFNLRAMNFNLFVVILFGTICSFLFGMVFCNNFICDPWVYRQNQIHLTVKTKDDIKINTSV